jgi:hypothetical protein
MRKYLSRGVVIAVAAMLLGGVSISTARSYLLTARASVQDAVRDVVPISFELKRLKETTKDLLPEIRSNQRVAAELEVEMDYLERGLNQLREDQKDRRQQMEKLRVALQSGEDALTFGDRSYTVAEVQHDLKIRLERFKSTEHQISTKEKLLVAKRRTLNAASGKIVAYQQRRDLLVEKAESLQAELKLAELAQANGEFYFDDSKMAQAQQLAKDVERRILTLHKVIEGEQRLDEEISVELDSRSVVEKYDEYFSAANLAERDTHSVR